MSQANINHNVVGELIYEELLKGYVGSIELSDMPFKINLIADDEQTVHSMADQLVKFLESDEFEQAFMAGLGRLLIIKNQEWLNDNEAEFTLEEFCDFVSLDGIMMYRNKIELYTDDLDLLWRNRAVMIYDHHYQLIDVIIEESDHG